MRIEEFAGFFDGEKTGVDDEGFEIYDREYNSEEFSLLFNSFFTNGVYPNPSTNLLVRAAKDFNINVIKGLAFINGRIYRLKDDITVKVQDSDVSFDRIDNVVIRLDLNKRIITIDIVEGIPSSKPVAPQLTRSKEIYELCIAQIRVKAAANDIAQEFITDTRHNQSLCGIVAETIKTFDSDELYIKYEDALKKRLKEIEDILGEDTVGELMNLINSKQDKVLTDRINGNKFMVVVENNRPYLEVVEVNE